VELVSLLAERLGAADHAPWSWLSAVDLNTIGIVIVVTFLVTWIGAVALWKLRRYDERYPARTDAEPDPASV
jgi:high-affinity nickel-transport protein